MATSDDGAALIWDTTTWEAEDPPLSRGGGSVLQAVFSPDGGTLVTIDDSGVLTFRDSKTLQPVNQLSGVTDAIEGFSYGPFFTDDGLHMVTTADGSGRVWDLADGVQVGAVFPSDSGTSSNASPNAKWLATIHEGRAVVWDLDLDSWYEKACRAAGRNLTQAEWDQFGPADVAYAQTCPQWPSLADNPEGDE